MSTIEVTYERGSVELVNVTKRYGDVVAVDSVDLLVKPGEFLSLLGPSGCGKTTTLRLLAGFEQPDEGFIRIGSTFVQGVPPYKRDVNTVFQHYSLFPHMNVTDNVAYGLRQRKVPKSEIASKIVEALAMVKMSKMASRKPSQLSGGQQQRVAVARALVNRPSVLLLDEPLGALDRKLREEMQIELKLLQSQLGITFIFVTHDQEEAMSMSNRIAVMLDGHIEQLADPDTIYEQPTSAFVAGFIGRNNFWRGTMRNDKVETLSGVFTPLRRVENPTEGSDAIVSVRPEMIEVTSQRPDGAGDMLQGRLISISHLGDVLQYVVKTQNTDLIVFVSRHDAPKVNQGDSVWCSWLREDMYLFGASQSELVFAEPSVK